MDCDKEPIIIKTVSYTHLDVYKRQEHVKHTGSEIGQEILDHFEEYLPKFKKVIPFDYEKMQTFVLQMEEKGLSSEQAKIEAFYAIKNGKE